MKISLTSNKIREQIGMLQPKERAARGNIGASVSSVFFTGV